MDTKTLVILCFIFGVVYYAHNFDPLVDIIPGPVVNKDVDLDQAEGMVAMDIAYNVIPDKPDNNNKTCKCNGTKKVRSPDGLTLIPCPCGKNCQCKRGDSFQRMDTPERDYSDDVREAPPMRTKAPKDEVREAPR